MAKDDEESSSDPPPFDLEYVEYLLPWLALGFSPIYNRESSGSYRQQLKAFCDSYNAAIKELGFKVAKINVPDVQRFHNSDEFEEKFSEYQKTRVGSPKKKSPKKGNGEVEKEKDGKKLELEKGALEILLELINEDRGTLFQLAFIREGFRGMQIPVDKDKPEWKWTFDAVKVEETRIVPLGGRGANVDCTRPVLFIWTGNERDRAIAKLKGGSEREKSSEKSKSASKSPSKDPGKSRKKNTYEKLPKDTWEGMGVQHPSSSGRQMRLLRVENWGLGDMIHDTVENGLFYLDRDTKPKDEEGFLEASRGVFVLKAEIEDTKEACVYMITMSPEGNVEEGWVKISRTATVELSALAPGRLVGRPARNAEAAAAKKKKEEKEKGDKEKYLKPISAKKALKSPKASKDPDKMDVDEEGESVEGEVSDAMDVDIQEEDEEQEIRQGEEIKFYRAVTFTSKIGADLTEQEELVLSVSEATYEPPRGKIYMNDDQAIPDNLGTIFRVKDIDGVSAQVRSRALQRLRRPWGLPDRLRIFKQFRGTENSTLGQLRKEAIARDVLRPLMDREAMLAAIQAADAEDKMVLRISRNLARQEKDVNGSEIPFEAEEFVRVIGIDADFFGTYEVRDFEGREGRIHGDNLEAVERPFGLELSRRGMRVVEAQDKERAERQAKIAKAKRMGDMMKKHFGPSLPQTLKVKGKETEPEESSPDCPAPKKIKKITQKVKDVTLDGDEDVEMEDGENEVESSTKKATAKKTPSPKTSKKSKVKDREVAEIPDTDEEDATLVKPKTPAPKKAPKRKAFELDDGTEGELASSPRTPAKSPRTPAKKKKKNS